MISEQCIKLTFSNDVLCKCKGYIPESYRGRQDQGFMRNLGLGESQYLLIRIELLSSYKRSVGKPVGKRPVG
jgi:hypothetical protein